jgi:hypothetical protein
MGQLEELRKLKKINYLIKVTIVSKERERKR